MYAKLVVGPSVISSVRAMRDIGRLITSANPTTALLSAFSSTSSIIIDPTPAGWSYVGSLNASDRPTIAAIGSAADTTGTFGYTADTDYNLAFSAPCLNQPSRLKYALLTIVWRGTTPASQYTFALTGAQSATDQGVRTNEGPRAVTQDPVTNPVTETSALAITTIANRIIHLIATPRHITIIEEGRGLCAVWEATNTDVHDFLNRPSFIQYSHATAFNTRFPIIIPTGYNTVQTGGWMAVAINITNPNTAVTYGTYDISEGSTANLGILAQASATYRNNSIDAAGNPRYQVGPVYFQIGEQGYPVQFVTGVVPIYWTRPAIGTTGDEIDINGDTYTFFNCGSTIGVAMKTS
jgi:hypothetical protein